MYKLLIVDDEEIIRDSLSTFIKWDKLGFEVVRCLSDGRDAIAYLSNNQVDVILCDIKMTFVSGLELACYVYENNLPIVVVIISGYKQFEFAQQAIKYNVAHYLLKPTQINEVNRTFTEIKRQLDLDIENRERLNKEREQYNELIGFLQEQFFTDLLMGALRDEDEILNRLKIARLEYELVNCSCCVMKIQLHNVDAFLEGGWEYGKSGFINMVKKLLGENDRKLFYYTMDLKSDAFFVLIINRSNIEGFQTYLENRSHEINASFRTAFNIETEVKVLGFYESMFHLHHSLYDLNHVESDVKRFFRSSDTEVSDTTIERKKLLVSNIVFGNLNFIAGLFDSLFDEAVGIGAGAGERQARDFLLDLITLLRNKLHDIDIDVSNAAKEVISYQYFLALNDVHQLREKGRNAILTIAREALEDRKLVKSKVIDKAKEFIKNNYSKDISLNDVADHVYLSPVYMSRFFKQNTGENYIDYLIHVRMERAQELLGNPTLKIYEISNMVGYNSVRHFTNLFINYAGMKPSDYRKELFREGSVWNE